MKSYKEIFLNNMGNIFDKAIERGIDPIDLQYYLKKELNLNLPCNEGFETIEENLSKANLGHFERRPKPYGYEIIAYDEELGEDGAKLIINIIDKSPFVAEITMYDSYYNPKDDYYECDCGKTYIDWDELNKRHPDFMDLEKDTQNEIINQFTYDNDNWEPAIIKKETITVKETEELWFWLIEKCKKMINEW